MCWVFVSVRGLPLVVASGVHSSSRCVGLSPLRPLLLGSTGSRCAGSAIVAHGPSRSTACGILPDQGSNPCPPHWQADSQPLCHQGSPDLSFLICALNVISAPLSTAFTTFCKPHLNFKICVINVHDHFFLHMFFTYGFLLLFHSCIAFFF